MHFDLTDDGDKSLVLYAHVYPYKKAIFSKGRISCLIKTNIKNILAAQLPIPFSCVNSFVTALSSRYSNFPKLSYQKEWQQLIL